MNFHLDIISLGILVKHLHFAEVGRGLSSYYLARAQKKMEGQKRLLKIAYKSLETTSYCDKPQLSLAFGKFENFIKLLRCY